MADSDKKISAFTAGTVDQSSYFLQANNGASSKVSAENIGDFVNRSQTYSGLDRTTAKSVVGAINEVAGKKLPATLTAGSTSLTFTDSAITADSLISVFTEGGLLFNSITTAVGSVVLTFDEQASDVTVVLIVR
jgi:hypothetical protein